VAFKRRPLRVVGAWDRVDGMVVVVVGFLFVVVVVLRLCVSFVVG
jgi:hypothetical protein